MLHKDRYIRLGKNTFYIVSHVVGDRSTQVDLDRAVRRIRFRFYPSGDTHHRLKRQHWLAPMTRERIEIRKGININTNAGLEDSRHRERVDRAVEVTDRDAQKHWQDYEVRCWYDGRQRRWRRRKEREGNTHRRTHTGRRIQHTHTYARPTAHLCLPRNAPTYFLRESRGTKTQPSRLCEIILVPLCVTRIREKSMYMVKENMCGISAIITN